MKVGAVLITYDSPGTRIRLRENLVLYRKEINGINGSTKIAEGKKAAAEFIRLHNEAYEHPIQFKLSSL